jgi:periplasmic glucans biosynthesis protein
MSLDRRSFTFGAAAALMTSPALAQNAQNAVQLVINSALGDGQKFEANTIIDIARVLAKRPYVAQVSDLPDPFGALNFEGYDGIRAKPEAIIWGAEPRDFAIEPLHRGFLYTNNVAMHVVEDGAVRRLTYDRSMFNFGKLTPSAAMGDIGFSGFRLFSTSGDGSKREIAIMQGASFFRASANGQDFGVTARGLTLRPAETRGEEFPIFRAFWIERPINGSGTLVVHALLDSESVVGAVRFTIRPGAVTIIDVEKTLLPRVQIDHIGFGGMSATYLFGPQSRRISDDVRPAVHEVQGLQMQTGRNEWIWRPLVNPETLQISVFSDESPKGFGLLQRERSKPFYEDDEQNFERRPSLWIEPLGNWGAGAVQLLEIPSNSEVNDNVLAYWRPRAGLAAGSETAMAYRQYWCWTPPEAPPLATVSATRIGRGSQGRRKRFIVTFTGEKLADASALIELKPVLSATPGAIHNMRIWPYPELKMVRVAFELDPGSESISELRLILESASGPLSETWLYRWTA